MRETLGRMFLASVVYSALSLPTVATANEEEQPAATFVHIRSDHLLIHTDLDRSAAKELSARLEAQLRVLSKYWTKPLRAPIECFIVHDLGRWQAGQLPDDQAIVVLERLGGFATIKQVEGYPRARMYATTRPGVAEHELVHAYCGATFQQTPPDWYTEGMAEYFANSACPKNGVQISTEALAVLKDSPARSVDTIVHDTNFTHSIGTAVRRVADADEAGRWQPSDDRDLASAKQSYYWSWALCHFMATNGNYRDRFRELGRRYQSAEPIPDDWLFGGVPQLTAEFQHFVENIESGYQVHACRWKWPTQQPTKDWCRMETVVSSRRSYQSAGWINSQQQYSYATTGTWQVGVASQSTDAGGHDDGTGRLEAVVLSPAGTLSETIDMGISGIFLAPCEGLLLLRCRDKWNSIETNRGTISVTVKTAARE